MTIPLALSPQMVQTVLDGIEEAFAKLASVSFMSGSLMHSRGNQGMFNDKRENILVNYGDI